jgi:hypothetical protein
MSCACAISNHDGTRSAELKIQLSEILLTENAYHILSKLLAATSLEEAMVKLEKAIPCLLHLENRSSDAIISHLVSQRLGVEGRLARGDKVIHRFC